MLLVVAAANVARAQVRDSSAAAKTSVLSGFVKDEYGDPLANAEVRVEPGGYGMRTDTTGTFRIAAPPGFYNVVFRRLGYQAEDFSWKAVAAQATSLSIRLDPIPHSLDTVTIVDRHDRAAGASSIGGVVVDTDLQPIPGVELQLIGTGRHATSYEDGVFFFSGLAEGSYVVRARRMGFTPVNLTVKVGKGELHDVAIRLTALPHTLATVEVNEKSGFGQSGVAWEEFDRRQRWKNGLTATVGRDELARLGKTPLDWALRRSSAAASLVGLPSWFGAGKNTSILGGGSSGGPGGVADDVCVLVNGMLGERRPLSSFNAQEVERVEVYPADTDWSLTVGSRMMLVKGCEPDGIHHPPYFVIWMRGNS
ncbi:MAG: carboxypeptidase regulatory-like domain-containing protein [Gemmatimonadota bacterium]|nr:carboxypeptidase regulatory-like domain-containing protein [Gemmatimonadota bacterium]